MKVEKKTDSVGDNILAVTFPNSEKLYVSDVRWSRFVETVKCTAAQFGTGDLKPFISVLDVFTAVRGTAITSVELTEDGKYNLK